MPIVTFKAKPRTVYNPDDTPAYQWVKVPVLSTQHCDMPAFRQSQAFGGIANSSLFPNALRRAVAALGVRDHLRLDQLPEGVAVDTTGFLAVITITIEEGA